MINALPFQIGAVESGSVKTRTKIFKAGNCPINRKLQIDSLLRPCYNANRAADKFYLHLRPGISRQNYPLCFICIDGTGQVLPAVPYK